MAHGRYITWGERIDEAKREVERATAVVKLRPSAAERLVMAQDVLARLRAAMKAAGKRRSHVARTINI